MIEPNPKHKWFVKKISDSEWYAESQGLGDATIHNSHCGACARTELIHKYGGWVDLRGLAVYGQCFLFLSVANKMSKFRVAEW